MLQHKLDLFSKENSETRPFQQLELEAAQAQNRGSVGTGSSCIPAKASQNNPKSPHSSLVMSLPAPALSYQRNCLRTGFQSIKVLLPPYPIYSEAGKVYLSSQHWRDFDLIIDEGRK